MSTRPYELLVRFGEGGRVAGASVRTITTVDGREFPSDPHPLSGTSDPAFRQFASQFAAAVNAERDALKNDCDALKTSVEKVTSERDGLQSQLDAALAAAGDLAAVTAERDALLLRVPPEPTATKLTRAAFIARLKPAELVGLFRSPEPAAVLAAVTLFTHDGLIDLESATLKQLLSGLVPMLGADRVAEIGKAD